MSKSSEDVTGGGPVTVNELVRKRGGQLVTTDCAGTLKIPDEVVLTHGVLPGRCFEADDWQAVLAAVDRQLCRECVLRILHRRAHSQIELSRKLYQRRYGRKLVAETLDWATEQGLLNDRLFCELFLDEKRQNGEWGPYRIRQELLRRGIDRELIDAAVDASPDYDETEQVMTLARKKWARLTGREEASPTLKQKLYRYLASRGFSFSLIQKALESLEQED